MTKNYTDQVKLSKDTRVVMSRREWKLLLLEQKCLKALLLGLSTLFGLILIYM